MTKTKKANAPKGEARKRSAMKAGLDVKDDASNAPEQEAWNSPNGIRESMRENGYPMTREGCLEFLECEDDPEMEAQFDIPEEFRQKPKPKSVSKARPKRG